MKINRRDLLRGTALAGGAALLGHATRWPGGEALAQDFGLASLPLPGESGIEHIVVVMMENRSFDHFLGWLPNAEGMQAGLTYLDSAGVSHATHALAPDFQGCSHPDPDHSYEGGRVQYDGGTMDGFLRSGKNDDVRPRERAARRPSTEDRDASRRLALRECHRNAFPCLLSSSRSIRASSPQLLYPSHR